jgi:hypothetical protein
VSGVTHDSEQAWTGLNRCVSRRHRRTPPGNEVRLPSPDILYPSSGPVEILKFVTPNKLIR